MIDVHYASLTEVLIFGPAGPDIEPGRCSFLTNGLDFCHMSQTGRGIVFHPLTVMESNLHPTRVENIHFRLANMLCDKMEFYFSAIEKKTMDGHMLTPAACCGHHLTHAHNRITWQLSGNHGLLFRACYQHGIADSYCISGASFFS